MIRQTSFVDPPFRKKAELRVSGFMFQVVRKYHPNTRNPELETRNIFHGMRCRNGQS